MSDLIRTKTAIDDCKLALKWFEKKPIDAEFRLTLFLCLSLLRAIGHILKREVKDNNLLLKLDQQLFASRKNDFVFAEFIFKFRNEVIKEYRSAVSWASIEVYSTQEHKMEYLIKNGVYAGKDVRDLIKDAILWWECYVTTLETNYYKCL